MIGRAQFDYHFNIKNYLLMLTAGILEDMFSGIGMGIYTFDKIQIIHLDLNYLM